jgi:hypothetical protein
MNLLNPFSKEGRSDTNLIDRLAVSILFIVIAFLTIAIPIILINWYMKANARKRKAFWLVVLMVFLCGSLFHEWIFA